MRNRVKAFTLIEVLVAAAITVIMVGLVIQITAEVLKVWNQSTGKLSANAEARIAMEILTNDLETAVFLKNDQQWLRVESETSVDSAGQTVALKLFAPALDRPKGPGDLCGISYRLAYAPAYTGASRDTYVLFRNLADPQRTFDELLGEGPNSPQSELNSGFWQSNSTVVPANYLAGNIVDFKVYIYGINEDTGEEIVLNASGNSDGFARNDSSFNGNLDLDYIYGGGGVNSTDRAPTSAEILLTIVSDEGLEILRLLSDGVSGTGFDDEEDVLLQYGEVFRRRVNFNSRPF